MLEFYRMCNIYGWGKQDAAKIKAQSDFKDALTLQFNAIYGEDEDSLEAWQKLCLVLNLGNIPTTLDECRNVSRMYCQ